MTSLKKINLFFLYLATFVISSSILMVEIVSTRVSKIAFGYDFQFVILSLALVGIGLGAIVVYFKWKRISRELGKNLSRFSLLYTAFLLPPFLIAHYANFYPAFLITTLFFLSSFLIYTLAGIILASIFREYSKDISRIYAISFIGSAFGALAAILLLHAFGTQISILLMLLFSTLAILSFSYSLGRSTLKMLSLFMVLLIFLLVVPFNNFFTSRLEIKCDPKIEILLSSSNSFSQIDGYRVKPNELPREISQNYDRKPLSTDSDTYKMSIDCIGKTRAIEYNKSKNIEFIAFDISNFPFMIRNYTDALIIGSGAGIDVVRARLSKIKNITAVEINPIIIQLADKLLSQEENVYYRDNVNLVVSEARGFIENSDNKYSLIYIPSSKSYGSSSIASYALLENYLFTEEAFGTYIKHLTHDGIFAIADINSFIERYIETLISTLINAGINPADHMFILEGKRTSIIIFQKQEFSDADKRNLVIKSRSLSFEPRFLDERDIGFYSTDYVSVTDNHPFFWNIYALDNIIHPNKLKYSEYASIYSILGPNLKYLFLLFFSILVVYLAIIFIPIGLKKINLRNIPQLLIYFSGIGIGFIAIELVLIQKFTLFLWHPVYSISLVLTSILFFGGIGSYSTRNIPIKNMGRTLKIAAFLLVSFLSLFLTSSDYIFDAFSNLNIIIRGLITIIILAFPGFLLGMFLPLGIKITEEISKDLIPWMWSVDAITTVLGGVASTIIALLFGFNAAMIFGMMFYLFAYLSISRVKKIF